MPPPNLRGVLIPFAEHLGIEAVRAGGGTSEMRFEPRPEHLNTFDVAHGGAIMTLLDVTMAGAARGDDPEYGVITIELKTSFMQPCRGVLTGKGRMLHRSRSMAFVEGTVYDEEGRACAHATGTFKFAKRQPAASQVSTD